MVGDTDHLVNRLKSLGDACQYLEQTVADNPKACELLYCIKGLANQLVIENVASPALEDVAAESVRKMLRTVRTATEIASTEVAAAMTSLHKNFSSEGSQGSIDSCKQLAQIETEYLRGMEKAFSDAGKRRTESGTTNELQEFDCRKLAIYLAKLFDSPDFEVTSIDVLSGGFSKQTLKVATSGCGGVPETLVLRLDLPADTAFSITTVDREFPKLMASWKNGLTVPRPYGLEASGEVLGRPFIVLDLAPGKTLGTLFNYPPPDAELGADIARQLARMHCISVEALLAEGMEPAKPSIEQIRDEINISRRHWNGLGRHSAIVEEGFAALERNINLAEGACGLVHGDVGLHNILVENSRVTALLDWEFAKIGNPADDLGYVKDTVSHLMGWDSFLAAYEAAGGTVPPGEQIDFYRLLSLVRICVLVNQADAAFCAGILPQIQYAPPGSYFLRNAMIKLGDMVQRIR